MTSYTNTRDNSTLAGVGFKDGDDLTTANGSRWVYQNEQWYPVTFGGSPAIQSLAVTTNSAQGVVNITSDGKNVGVAQHVRGVQSKLIIDGGTDTGLIRPGAFANLSGTTWTITEGTDADGFFVQLLYTGVGGTHAIAAFPTALDLSSGGGMDWVFDVEFPSGISAPACTLSLFLSNNSTLSNSASRTATWNPGGTVGALKPGRNSFFSRTESSVTAGVEGSTATGYYGSNWSVNGAYTTASPITHASIQFSVAPEVGTIIKLRRVYYNNINTPALIFGCDDGHNSSYWLYKLAASFGIKGVLPVVGNFSANLASYMKPDKLRELHDLGFTVCNHTWNHTDMMNFTYAQALDAIGTNHNWILSQGFPAPKILVYPGGHYNDEVIRAATDLGYMIARTAGKRSLRSTPAYRLENLYRLGSFDTGGQTYDTIRNAIRAGLADAGSELMWLYGHQVTPGNPATNAAAPGDTNLWYAGWYRQLLLQVGQWVASGLIRPMSGQDLIDSL